MQVNLGALRRHWAAVALLALTAAAMVYTYVTIHQIFPDTQYYIGWTYRILGHSPADSSHIVHEYVRTDGVFKPYDDIWGWYAGTKLTQPRVLLPILSVPFVLLFGPGGIVVIPGIAFAASAYLMYRFAAAEAGPVPALVAAAIPLFAPLAMVWSVGGLTDSLALLLHVVLLLLLPWRSAVRWPALVAIASVCALTGTARFIAPFTVATVGLVWLWAMWRFPGRRWNWTFAAAAAAAGELVAMLWTRYASSPLAPRTQLYMALGNRRKAGQTLKQWFIANYDNLVREELKHILGEPALVVLIALAIAGCIVAWRSAAVPLVLAALAGSLGILVANPAATHFRYEIPTLPALVFAAALFVQWVWAKWRPPVVASSSDSPDVGSARAAEPSAVPAS